MRAGLVSVLRSRRGMDKVVMAALLGTVVCGIAVAVLPLQIVIGCLAVIVLVPTLVRVGLWRTLLLVSFACSLLRSNEEFSHLATDSVWYVAQFAPIAAAVVVTALQGRSGAPRLHFVVGLMSLFAGLALASLTWSIDPQTSLSQGLVFAFVALFLCLTATWRWSRRDVLRGDLATVFAAACAAQLLGLLANLTGVPWAVGATGEFQGLLSNPNFAGMLSAVTIPLVFFLSEGLEGVRRLALLGGTLVLAWAMILSGSRGALLGCLVGLVAAAFSPTERRRAARIAWAGSIVALLAVILDPRLLSGVTGFFASKTHGDFTSGRYEIYRILLSRWRSRPIFGTGFHTAEIYGIRGVLGHNIYLTVLAELGIVGASLFLTLIVAGWRSGAKSGPERPLVGPAVAVLVVELTESSLFGFGNSTALFFWMLLFAFAASGRFERTDRGGHRVREVNVFAGKRHASGRGPP